MRIKTIIDGLLIGSRVHALGDELEVSEDIGRLLVYEKGAVAVLEGDQGGDQGGGGHPSKAEAATEHGAAHETASTTHGKERGAKRL